MTVLEVGPVSQSSARQRSGRAGRTAPGVSIRLYSEIDFCSFVPTRVAEIQRTSLTLTLLKILKAGVSNPAVFPFIEAPDPNLMSQAIDTLELLGDV